MSEIGSCVSLKPTSTVVGCRDSEVDSASNLSKADADETSKRDACAYFEEKLKLADYLRDKNKEERPSHDRYIRINSKTLRCSYELPADEVHGFLCRLYKFLAPGLRLGSVGLTEEDRSHLKALNRWRAYSDLTVQVFPRTPTVLWLDLECMKCKGAGRGLCKKNERHLKSKEIIEIVVDAVTTFTSDSQTCRGANCDSLYVTRGGTCGMHLFFPHVTVNSSSELEDVWAAINRRLVETGHTAATVDTGCSSMPLPLARRHNGLTRVEIKQNEGGGEPATVTSYQLKCPGLKDLARITNFYHFLAGDLKESTQSPPSSEASAGSGVSGRTEPRASRRRRDRSVTGEGCSEAKKTKLVVTDVTCVETTSGDRAEKRSEDCDSAADDVESADCGDRGRDHAVSGNAAALNAETRVEETTAPTAGNSENTELTPPSRVADDTDHEEIRSTSSKAPSAVRLLQTDIRVLCARTPTKTRTSTPPCGEYRRDERDGDTTFTDAGRDDAASSFVGMGYVPSLRQFGTSGGGSTLTTEDEGQASAATSTGVGVRPDRIGHRRTTTPQEIRSSSTSSSPSPFTSLRALYVSDPTPPGDARIPDLVFSTRQPERVPSTVRAREDFVNSMQLRLDDAGGRNRVHNTDLQVIVNGFDSELQFYNDMMKNSTPIADVGPRIKDGGSLHASRDNCPTALFPDYVPRVLYSEDFVSEPEWVEIMVRYFDEYLNGAPFLYVMSHVLRRDENVKKGLTDASRQTLQRCVDNCLQRFRRDVVGFQRRVDTENHEKTCNATKHPYEEKCTVVLGLIAICSLAFEMVTPVFTDLAKVCRLVLGNDKQTLNTLNASTVCSTTSDDSSSYDAVLEEFDDSVSRSGAECIVAGPEQHDDCAQYNEVGGGSGGGGGKDVSANIGNCRSILASILRWNYAALGDQTLWSLFFYYHHVHADALTRIMDEMVHAGLMVTAILQAYFEDFSGKGPVDVRLVCGHVYRIDAALNATAEDEEGLADDEDNRLMPPPPKKSRSGGQRGKARGRRAGVRGGATSAGSGRGKHRVTLGGGGEEEEEDVSLATEGGLGDSCRAHNTCVADVLTLFVKHYFRPVSFDETTVLYTEAGYEPCQNEFTSYFSGDKDRKRTVMDVFNRGVLKYSMPHGDLLLHATDVLGSVHCRTTLTNNLPLQLMENTYGGIMTYLKRNYNKRLKLFNRFNGSAYLLVVECRHAMSELKQHIDLAYMNLILRLPIVPPVLEADVRIRNMFMSRRGIETGAFVCLKAWDYVCVVNMYTGHSEFSREICRVVDAFLDGLIKNRDALTRRDGDAGTQFRTVYLFFLLYTFEVLYKIRHAYHRDRAYNVSIERLSLEVDVRVLLKLFFGSREFQVPRGLCAQARKELDLRTDAYDETAPSSATTADDYYETEEENRAAADRCINTRPVVSAALPDKTSRMKELFGKKGLVVMKSHGPLGGGGDETHVQLSSRCTGPGGKTTEDVEEDGADDITGVNTSGGGANWPTVYEEDCRHGDDDDDGVETFYVERDRSFLSMPQSRLEEELYSGATWYENCRVRMEAVRIANKAAGRTKKDDGKKEVGTFMDAKTMDTFLRTQLSVNIDNGRLNHVERAVRENKDFAFCTHLPLRTKVIALVMATHAVKRLTSEVAAEFVRKTYASDDARGPRRRPQTDTDEKTEERCGVRPEVEWEKTWRSLLDGRRGLLAYCHALADAHFPHEYFVGLQPNNAYNALYNYMMSKTKYATLHSLRNQQWAKDVCTALNYLLVMNAYDPELVDFCLRLFLGFEWPGQWAKRIFVWKSNSNAGKSFLFEHILRKAFDQSTCINDPKGGKENAPEKSEYYKNFVLMINEFTTASASELKKLCSTSGYKFRMNFGNQMIQAFMVGKMVFNCNTLPLTTDHATIQRVALVPLPFWFQKRQSVPDAMLNWTRGQSTSNEYEKNFRRNLLAMLTTEERQTFVELSGTQTEDDLLNTPNELSLQTLCELSDRQARAPMFLVQNKASHVYMLSHPPVNTIIDGIVHITRYFCRFRFFSNNLKEPVDYSALPTACVTAAQEWQRVSQPYFDWKVRYRVLKDYKRYTSVSEIHKSLNHFVKTYAKNASFFDLQQFFEWDFAEQKVPHFNRKEDAYNVTLEIPQD